MTDDAPKTYRYELTAEPAMAQRTLATLADTWAGTWQPEGLFGGRLGLPVLAGVRRGWVEGTVRLESAGQGTQLSFEVDDSVYRIEKFSVATLLIAACGALVTLFAPFFPKLFAFVPIGILLSLGAWFFIVARLRNSGPEEFFENLDQEIQLATGETAEREDGGE